MSTLNYRVMDTQIFNLNLSVFASSAYIVICSLVGDGMPATLENLLSRWMGKAEQLEEALKELAAWRVIEAAAGPAEVIHFAPNPASIWRTPGSPKTN
ncbi:MAG: hypothetical protein LBE31_06475 [Deltaproteobacteria bacterium]|jgi:hypothetical protein|nr:hypothetical protein [Deltaproteobacteria bacterium]